MGPAGLKQIGYYKPHPKQADIDGYKKGKGPANGEVIANHMYDDNYRGAKYKLGNTSPGDGWKYLGRGLKQLTGKSNYQDLPNMYSTIWADEKVDFVKNPELIEQPKYAVRSAIRFWLKYKLYDIADKGATGAQVDNITKVINEGTDSYSARRTHFVKANTIFI
ncbi:glycoside hydrolase family 19 protein [Acinetobacter sp. TSRC1-2]|uniref:glycoside hydrolase family 19 protein n=1 Tax=unclassified Acinetobacter TaxID=196816 RepID=UPI003CEBDAD4